MEQLEQDIWEVARDKATYRTGIARFSSALGTKLHKWKKPGNIVKTTGKAGGALIPVPGLSIATDWVIEKIEGKMREHYREKRLEQADQAGDEYKKVKFEIKTLDISKLDRARYKAENQLTQLNSTLHDSRRSLSQCVKAFGIAYRYHRAQHRAKLLRYQATAMKDVAENILHWCDQVETNLCSPAIVREVQDLFVATLDHEPKDCGGIGAEKGCFNASGKPDELREMVKRISWHISRDEPVDLP